MVLNSHLLKSCVSTAVDLPLCRCHRHPAANNLSSTLDLIVAQWIYLFAGAIDTELPQPTRTVHMMLKHKAAWVEPQVRQICKRTAGSMHHARRVRVPAAIGAVTACD